jgi:hypothetical protein
VVEAGTTGNRLREGAIGLPQVLFQSITHMAPGAAIAFSIYLSIVYDLFVGETPVGIAGPDVPPPLPSGAVTEPA